MNKELSFSPSFVLLDQANQGTTNPVKGGYGIGSHLTSKCPDFFSLNSRQFRPTVSLASLSGCQAKGVGVAGIFRSGDPFEITDSVVSLVTVNVIDLKVWPSGYGQERFPHKSVYPRVFLRTYVSAIGSEVKVTVPVAGKPENLPNFGSTPNRHPLDFPIITHFVEPFKSRCWKPLFVHSNQSNSYLKLEQG